MHTRNPMRIATAALAFALFATACQTGPDAATQAKVDSLTKTATDRERLLAEVAQNDRMMSEISADLARVKMPRRQLHVSNESPLGAARDSIVEQVQYVAARVLEAEQKLHQSEQHIHTLTSLSDSLRTTLETTVANYDSVIVQQKAAIAQMTDQINQLTATNAQLTTQNVALTDTTTQLKQQNNTVYYVVGTKDELLRKGIVVEVGGSRFPLLFAKVGQTIVPGRALDPKDFTPINKRVVTDIPLAGHRDYRIASLQDVNGLATPPDDGRISGHLTITNPDRFWATSKFLILIEG